MTATKQPDQSAAPGIIPRPVHVQDDAAPPSAPTEHRHDRKPGRRDPLRVAVAKAMSALRGDKYMVDAYPAAEHDDSAASGNAATTAAER